MAKKRKAPKKRVSEAIALKHYKPKVIPGKRRLKFEQELDQDTIDLIEEAFEIMEHDDESIH